MNSKRVLVVAAGGTLGLLAVVLVAMGNPANMGYCVACFLRDITGGLGLHRAAPVQYIRPEIIGLVLGAFLASQATKEFRPIGGSSSFTRFVLGFLAMIGMLVFLGCPVRAVLRLAGGDLNAGVGLLGLGAGVAIGVQFLKSGFSLGRAVPQQKGNGYIFTLFMFLLLILLLARPSFIFFSEKGPGSMHAPVWAALGAGLVIGVLAQRSRLCMVGGIRDFIMFRDAHLLYGFVAIFVVALVVNLAVGAFKIGFAGQPVAHTDGLWNFLGMALAGWAAVLLGGCPLRQLVAAAEGNTDSALTVMGIIFGAAVSHNFGLAGSPTGVPVGGQIAVILGLIAVFIIGCANRPVAVKRGVSVGKGS
ncbi:YedE-related selenium metabolism membrane protein [Desulfofundulus sp. TPOSR]|uniref:YedE family putative selenium transporter n=1 Tax=Desulfofundulus sp. TPOSR TaxID=2714340 RepID=UPI00140D75AD|nr:YedE family putative selenium transporter [Desulfofundulus sp. TPOSR]NHM26427.1 YedE-related selenium metabolism membrane protein [Desulfofundulus sp. TPOSR]